MAGIVNWLCDYLEVAVKATIATLVATTATITTAVVTTLTATTATATTLKTGGFGVTEKAVASGHADITLTAAEQLSSYLSLSGTPDGTVPVIATPTKGKVFWVTNLMTGQSATIKATGQTGITVATGKSAGVVGNGTDFVRLSTDA